MERIIIILDQVICVQVICVQVICVQVICVRHVNFDAHKKLNFLLVMIFLFIIKNISFQHCVDAAHEQYT